MLRKRIVIPATVFVLSGATFLGASQVVHAQTTNPLSGLVQAIAQKFNLDQNQVQSVVNQYREQHKTTMQQHMQQRIDNRLDQAVKNGKLTDSQKQAILSELQTLENKYSASSLKSMTPAQRKQAFQNERADIKSWAQANGIDPKYLMRGFGMRRLDRLDPIQSPTP